MARFVASAADSLHVKEAVHVHTLSASQGQRATLSVAILRGGGVQADARPASGHVDLDETDSGLGRNTWDLTLIPAGMTVGGLVGRLPGAVVGAIVMYLWGEWRWRSERSGEP